MEKTIGEKRAGTDFNITEGSLVGVLKHGTAQLINIVNSIDPSKKANPIETARWKATALMHYEIAAMFAEKAAE